MDDLKNGALYIGTIPSSMDNNRCSVTLEDDGSVTFYIYAPNANKVEVAEIASRLHFSDQYSFTKSFKKYYGETPGKFKIGRASCRERV